MSYHVFFSFSTGLSKPLKVPKGTLASITSLVEEVERLLKLEREQYMDNPPHWTSKSKRFDGLDDKLVCEMVSRHNRWVRSLYERFGKWTKQPVKDGELITPEQAASFWHGLELLSVDPERWTADYYREQMERLYEVIRGRETDGVSFNAKKPLTTEQADAVIMLFAEFLDTHDIRLAVPVGCDHLASSQDGEYHWSSTCGAISEDDVEHHAKKCRKKGCDVKEQFSNEVE